MAGPWEKYATESAAPAAGPWTQFQPQAEVVEAPQPDYQLPEGYSIQETDRGRFIVTPQGQWQPLEVDGVVNEIAQRAADQNPDDLERAVNISNRAQRIDAGGDTSGGFAGNFLRGAPFVGSYADEAIGAVTGALTGQDAGDMAQKSRDITDAYAVARPSRAMGANVAGAVVGSAPLAAAAGPRIAAAMPATRGGQALAGLGLGAVGGGVEGAVYGSGQGAGEGPSDTRAGNALSNAALGAGLGAVTGAAAPYVAAGGRQIARRALEFVRGKDVDVIARELGVSTGAARQIRNAIQSGDDDAALAAIQRGGDSSMLGDANDFTRSLVDTAAQAPGGGGAVARGAVNERVTAATRQMNKALDDVLGAPRGEREMIGDIMTESAGPRQAAYDRAFAQPINYASGQGRKIESVLQRVDPATLRGAVDEANAQMRDLGITNRQIRATIGDNGEVVFDTMPDVRQLDALKQSLDSVAENSKNAQGVMSPQGRRAARQAADLRQAISEAAPAYDDAVRLGGQAIAERNAVNTGYDLLTANVRREDLAQQLHKATPAERDSMRAGVRSYVDEVTSRIARTITDNEVEAREGIRILRDFSSRGNQTKLRMLLGAEKADTLLSQIDEAATGFELRAAIAGNSRTFARTANAEGIRQEASGGVLRTLMQGEPVNATKLLVQGITGETDEAQMIREMGLYQEISEALVNTRGPRAERALRLIEGAAEGQQITERQAEFVARALTSSGLGAVPVVSREASNSLAIQ